MTVLTGWGRATSTVAEVLQPSGVDEVRRSVLSAGPRGVLARGLGRSYGDAATNGGGLVVDCASLSEIGVIDETGVVTVGAGASIGSLIDTALPRGWFVPVTPGTRHVTLGGAVAADVHGKNHHRDGSISRYVVSLDLVDGEGSVRTLTPSDPAFGAVIGGLGLSGVITAVRLRLVPVESAGILAHTRRTTDLDDTMTALQEADSRHRYTVAWLDTLAGGTRAGRGVVTSGDHAAAGDDDGIPLDAHRSGRNLRAPSWTPSGLLTPATVRAFNAAWYHHAPAAATTRVQSVRGFFHPLDGVEGWNRLYGRRGFVQHQFAVADGRVVREVLAVLRSERLAGFLAVLKRFGEGGPAPLSFPVPGWTLAVDLPAHPSLGPVLDRVDRLVAGAGGRAYLAKDSRVHPDLVTVMYPDLDQWRHLRAGLDPHGVFVSDLSRRLALC